MLQQQVSLTTSTVLNLIRRRGADPHTVLASTPVWEDEQASRRTTERADAELAQYGLCGDSGVDPGLEYFAWVNGGYENQKLNYTLFTGASGGEAFALIRDTDHEVVVLASIPPNELLDNFLAQLPGLGSGRGDTLRVPRSALVGGGRERENADGFTVLRGNTRHPAEAEAAEAQRVLGLPRLGGGNLYAAARNRSGRHLRIERPVNYIDTTEGRWLTEEAPGSGEPTVVLQPADPRLLGDRLRRAKDTLPSN